MNPAPAPVRQRAVLHLSRLLNDCALPDHEVYIAPIDLYLDEHTMVEPDLVVLPVSSVGAKRLSLPVDIVVEVLSPPSRKLDRAVKFERYAEAGIPCYWIVDAEAHTVERYQLVGSSYQPR